MTLNKRSLLLSILLPVGLLANNANASCLMNFKIENRSGHVIDNVIIDGPVRASARQHKLKHGESFTHRADNFRCHGTYYLQSNKPSHPGADRSFYLAAVLPTHNYSKNANVTVTITENCKKINNQGTDVYQCASVWTPSKN